MTIYTRRQPPHGIPIVPMLDILTILLIFFIVHTEFKRQVNVLHPELPQTQHLAGETADRNCVLLEIGIDGSPALNGKPLPLAELAPAVTGLLTDAPDTRIQVAADKGISMGHFIEVMDILTGAGVKPEEISLRINPGR